MAGARLARNEGRQMTRRSLTSTMPAELAPPSGVWLSDRPGWCVDVGPTLVAMKTCDLWLALAKDEITPKTKVWREGMPYWTEIAKVPEFALAMPDAAVWDGPVKAAPAAGQGAAVTVAQTDTARSPAPQAPRERGSRRSSRGPGDKAPASTWSGAAPGVVAASDPSAAAVGSLVPPSDHGTPAPVVVEHRAPEPSAASPRRIYPRLDRRGAASVAFGALVAIAALTFATTGPAPGRGVALDSGPPVAAGARDRSPAVDFAAFVRAPSTARLPAPPTTPTPPDGALPPAAEQGPITAAIAPGSATAEVRSRPARGPHSADRGQRRAR